MFVPCQCTRASLKALKFSLSLVANTLKTIYYIIVVLFYTAYFLFSCIIRDFSRLSSSRQEHHQIFCSNVYLKAYKQCLFMTFLENPKFKHKFLLRQSIAQSFEIKFFQGNTFKFQIFNKLAGHFSICKAFL